MIENYLTYLAFLDEKFQRFFKSQKPYIFCKKGCSLCCKGAQFPYSQMEAAYLLQGATLLDEKTQKTIQNNVTKILEDKKVFKGEVFRYDCPFLINDECCVYEYRGIVCRTFGLLQTCLDTEHIKSPFCRELGLNYSNVLEDDGKSISPEKFKKLGVEEEPLAFNINYYFLTDSDFERGFNFKFGDKKPLIEWFEKTDKPQESIFDFKEE